MGQARVIKRYSNRKMYDTTRSCYVTLEEVADMVRGGLEVRVIDNKSKADLTEVTLAQALLDSERKRRGSVPLSGIRTLISQGGDFLHKRVAEPVTRTAEIAQRSVTAWRDEAERTMQNLVHEAEHLLRMAPGEGGDGGAAANAGPTGQGGPNGHGGAAVAAGGDGEGAKAEAASQARPPRRWPLPSQFNAEELQALLDEQLRSALLAFLARPEGAAPLPLSQEVEQLRERVTQLEARVVQLESALAHRDHE